MINFNSIKNICLTLLISSFFSQLAYANKEVTLNFSFIYGQGVNSVSYDNLILSEDDPSNWGVLAAPFITNESYTVTVHTQINPEEYIATDFNNKLSNNGGLALELGSTNAQLPSKLDFMITGGFSINDHKVSAESFYLAHDSKDNNNWWIGSPDGSRYSPNPLLIGNIGMDLHTTDDPNNIQYFCLKQDSSSNYRVIVVAGKCDQTNWSNLKTVKFDFVPVRGTSVTSVSFVYNNMPQTRDDLHNSIDFFRSLTDYDYSAGNRVEVTSKLAADESIATSFNQLGVNPFSLKNPYTTDLPTTLYFWVQGSLYINGDLIANDFTLALSSTKDGGQWWMGSSNGNSNNGEFILPDPRSQIANYCLSRTATPYIIDVSPC